MVLVNEEAVVALVFGYRKGARVVMFCEFGLCTVQLRCIEMILGQIVERVIEGGREGDRGVGWVDCLWDLKEGESGKQGTGKVGISHP